MTVLFISSRPMPRCENITAVYEAYDGDKIFNRMYNRTSDILSGKKDVDYDLVVTDELVKESKAALFSSAGNLPSFSALIAFLYSSRILPNLVSL